MLQLYQDSYLTLCLLSNENILLAQWTPKTEWMEGDDFKKCISHLWKSMADHKPIGLLADTRSFLYIIPPEVQEWYGANIILHMGEHTRKVAMLVSTEVVSQISIEQTIEEDHRTGFLTKYFDDEQVAKVWLLE